MNLIIVCYYNFARDRICQNIEFYINDEIISFSPAVVFCSYESFDEYSPT